MNMIEDEINAASAFAEWKIAVDRETIELGIDKEAAEKAIVTLNVKIAAASTACGTCRTE